MQSSVFVELKFWLLIVVSVVVPVFMYFLQRRRHAVSPQFVLTFGLVLIAISGLDVYLLQTLAAESRLTHSLMDNAIFNSEMSLSLYAFPFLFGGVGINMVSDMLVGHLMNAEERYEQQHPMPGPSSRRESTRTKASPGALVQVGKSARASRRVMLACASQPALHRKASALITSVEPAAHAPSIAVNELLSPAFMAAHTRFGTIDELLEAGGFRTTSAEDGHALSSASWEAFVRSTTRFTSWESMLQSACCRWMAHKLNGEPADRTRPRLPFASAWSITTFQPTPLHWQRGSAGTHHMPRGNGQASCNRAGDIGTAS